MPLHNPGALSLLYALTASAHDAYYITLLALCGQQEMLQREEGAPETGVVHLDLPATTIARQEWAMCRLCEIFKSVLMQINEITMLAERRSESLEIAAKPPEETGP